MSKDDVITKWLTQHQAKYCAITQFHIQKPRYASASELEHLSDHMFGTREEAAIAYIKSKIDIAKDFVMDSKAFNLQTFAVVPMPKINEYINGKDIVAAINANIFNSHGISDTFLASDVDEKAYEYIDTISKKIVQDWIEFGNLMTKNFMVCHFKTHSMLPSDLEDLIHQHSNEQ